MVFELDPQLAADTLAVADLELCTLRLMNCAALPWLVLVPRRAEMREIIDLLPDDQLVLWKEITTVSQILKALFDPQKLNIAALGNVVPQLHIHAVARFESDAAWPRPVWGNIPIEPYTLEMREAMLKKLRAAV